MRRFLLISLVILGTAMLKAQNTDIFDEVSFVTSDGIKISASYGLSESDSPLPAIILIHQGGSSREEWFELPLVNKLIQKGYAVLAYDVRIHGRSGKDKGNLTDLFNNPKRAPLDLKAAIRYLEQDQRIDSERIGIIGASIGANLACVAAASDQYNVQSIVSISAKVSAVESLSGSENPLTYNNAFYMASMEEQGGLRKDWANELFDKTKGQRTIKIAPGDKHGSYILREHPAIGDEIIEWFGKTL